LSPKIFPTTEINVSEPPSGKNGCLGSQSPRIPSPGKPCIVAKCHDNLFSKVHLQPEYQTWSFWNMAFQTWSSMGLTFLVFGLTGT